MTGRGGNGDGGQTPDFYEDPQNLPPAPPFMKWTAYKSNVPPLPSVASILGPAFVKYKWLYDDTFRVHSYTFTSFDKVLPPFPFPRVCISSWFPLGGLPKMSWPLRLVP